MQKSHRQYLLSQIRHLDELLADLAALLEPPRAGRLFHEVIADLGEAEKQALQPQLAAVRKILQRFLLQQGLNDGAEPVSARHAFRVGIAFARTAVEEMQPRYLRGYGELDARSAAEMEQWVAELMAVFQHIADQVADQLEQNDSPHGPGESPPALP